MEFIGIVDVGQGFEALAHRMQHHVGHLVQGNLGEPQRLRADDVAGATLVIAEPMPIAGPELLSILSLSDTMTRQSPVVEG